MGFLIKLVISITVSLFINYFPYKFIFYIILLLFIKIELVFYLECLVAIS